MKTVKWQNCITRGVQGGYPPESGIMLTPDNKVIPGMKVLARYNDLSVALEIKEEVDQNIFTAVVLNFEPVLAEKPSDLAQGEEVSIERQYICWLSA